MGKRKQIEKPYNAGTFSVTAFWSFIKSALRKQSIYWKPIQNCKNNSRRKYEGENKRQKWEYQCNMCKNWFSSKDCQVDHIIPVGSLQSYEDLPGIVKRMFCEENGLQVLCSNCHNEKTKLDIEKIKKDIRTKNK